MSAKYQTGVALFVAFVVVTSFAVPTAEARVQDNATKADVRQDEDPDKENINVRYARKRLEIAKTDLEIALSQNRRIQNSNNKVFLNRLNTQIELAEMILATALKDETVDAHKMHIKRLEASVDLTKSQLEWIRKINIGIPGMYREEYLNRAQQSVELAQLELEKATNSRVTKTPIDHLQWQIDQIQSEMLFMQLKIERLGSAR